MGSNPTLSAKTAYEDNSVAEAMRLYSYTVDRLRGGMLPEPVGQHNHTIDALHHTLQPLIRQPRSGLLTFMSWDVERMHQAEEPKG